MRLFCVILLMVLLTGAGSGQADVSEVDPYREQIVVTAEWGSAVEQFTQLVYWGKGEVERGPGPFCISKDSIYVADCGRPDVKIYDKAGSFVRSVPLPVDGRWRIDDMIALNGTLYWMTEGIRRLLVGGIRLPSGETFDIPVPDDPNIYMTSDGKSDVWGLHRLAAADGKLCLYNRSTGISYFLAAGPSWNEADSEEPRSLRGWPIARGVRVVEIDGSGDIAILDSPGSGKVGRILSGRLGALRGADAAGNLFLSVMHVTESGEEYFLESRDMHGELITRTAIRRRPLVGVVITGPRFRVAPDGQYYEIHLSKEEGVRISRWSH